MPGFADDLLSAARQGTAPVETTPAVGDTRTPSIPAELPPKPQGGLAANVLEFANPAEVRRSRPSPITILPGVSQETPTSAPDDGGLMSTVVKPIAGGILSAFGAGMEGLGVMEERVKGLFGLAAPLSTRAAGRSLKEKGERLRGESDSFTSKVAGGIGSTIGGTPLIPFVVFDEAFQAAKANGATDDQAAAAALPAMAVNTALELVSLGTGVRAIKALGKLPEGGFKKAVTFAYNLVKTGGTEAGTEAAQQTLTNIVGKNYDPVNNTFSLEGATAGVGESAAVGGAVGVILPGLGGIANATVRSLGATETATPIEETPEAPGAVPAPIAEPSTKHARMDAAADEPGPLLSQAIESPAVVEGIRGNNEAIRANPAPDGTPSITDAGGMPMGEFRLRSGLTPLDAEVAPERGLIGNGAANLSRSIVGFPNRLAADIFNFYQRPLRDAVKRSKTDIGPDIGYLAEKTADAHRRLYGKWATPIAKYQKLIDGKALSPAKAVQKQRAFQRLTRLIPSADGTYSTMTFQAAVEEDATLSTLPDYERKVVEEYRGLVDMVGKETEKRKILFRMRDGTVVPFEARLSNRLARAYTDQFYELLRAPGKNAKAYQTLVHALSELNHLPVADVEMTLEGARTEINERQIGLEQARKFEKVPSVLHTSGGNIPILHADPFMAAESLKTYTAGRLAFMEVFGQGQEATLKKLPDLYEQQGGHRPDMVNLIRSLQFQPIEEPHRTEMFRPGEPGYLAARTGQTLLSLWKAARLSLSFVPNLPETVGKVPALVGKRAYVRALAELLTGLGGKVNEADLAIEFARQGAHTIDVANFNFDKSFALESLGRLAHQTFNAAGIRVNEWNEIIAAHSALIKVRDWKRGRVSALDDGRLEFLRFQPFERKELLSGKADPEMYSTYMSRAVAETQGTTLHPSETSRAGHSRTYKALIPFDRYGQMTMNRMHRAGQVVADRMREGAPISDIVKSGLVLAEMTAGHAAAGAMSVLLRALVVGGVIGFRREAEDAVKDFSSFLWNSFQYATLSRGADLLNKAVTADSIDGAIYEASHNLMPVNIARDVMDLWQGEGRYAGYNGLERGYQFILANTTGLRALDSLGAIYGLSARDGELDLATKAYYRFIEKNKGFERVVETGPTDDTAFAEESEQFRGSMKAVARLIRDNAAPEKITAAIEDAVGVRGADSVAASLLGRRFLVRIPVALRPQFATDMRPEDIAKLAAYDDLLKTWAAAVRESGKGADLGGTILTEALP